MPFVMKKVIRDVVHTGHLDRPRAERPPTTDGPCLAVSMNADHWRRAAGLNGPDWPLHSRQAEWVDAISMGVDGIEEIAQWAIDRRYMQPAVVYTVDWEDKATGRFHSGTFGTMEEAAAKVGRTQEDEFAALLRGQGAVTDLDGYRLHKRAIRKLGGWPDPLNWTQAIILLYTREIIMMKHPYVVGLWWDEPVTKRGDVAPSGLIFPERTHVFTVETEDGEDKPFDEAFPAYDRLNGRSAEDVDRKLVWV